MQRAVKLVMNYWQDSSTLGFSEGFQAFCDWLEIDRDRRAAPAEGWGLTHALKAWGSYWKEYGFYRASTC